jgi:hypothetical protein
MLADESLLVSNSEGVWHVTALDVKGGALASAESVATLSSEGRQNVVGDFTAALQKRHRSQARHVVRRLVLGLCRRQASRRVGNFLWRRDRSHFRRGKAAGFLRGSS